jgi:hypothetical protein
VAARLQEEASELNRQAVELQKLAAAKLEEAASIVASETR